MVTQALVMLMFMVALIAEHCNLDQLASEKDDVQSAIESLIRGASLRLSAVHNLGVQRRLTKQPCVYEHLYDVFREFSTVDMPQQAPIMSLGEPPISYRRFRKAYSQAVFSAPIPISSPSKRPVIGLTASLHPMTRTITPEFSP